MIPKKIHDVLLKIFTTDSENLGIREVVFSLPLIRTVANVVDVVLEEVSAFRSELAASNKQVQSAHRLLESGCANFVGRDPWTNADPARPLLKTAKLPV